MLTSKLSSNGQIILPKKVRQALNLKAGERVYFLLEDGVVLLRAAVPGGMRSLAGSLHHYVSAPHASVRARDAVKKEVACAAAQEG